VKKRRSGALRSSHGPMLALIALIVERVSNGDTVVLRFPHGRRERTRLIGLDAPESREGPKLTRDAERTGRDRATIQALGQDAAAFTRRLLPEGTSEVESEVEKRDRHGRLLTYLWLDGEV
jgi:micrococcal nuclease